MRILKTLSAAELIFAITCVFAASSAAGPPFITDDPEPVELRHWEFYAASSYNHSAGETIGTAPHIEINYGAVPETQLHIIVPAAYSVPAGKPSHYGPGDVELGVKYRFLSETSVRPQAGLFPLVELPAGDSAAGLGSGHTSAFVPVWIQKSFGPWTSYAGGGYWFNKTSAGDTNYWQAGWQVQRDLSKALTVGAEIFNFSSRSQGDPGETALNAGLIINFNEEHHLLLSAGGDTYGPNTRFAYAAFQWTLGPK
jgi:hypothetical protein